MILVAALVAVTSSAIASSQSAAGMYGISIKNYKVNRDGTVTINVKIRGLKMAAKAVGKKNVAGQGHWHIYVNGKYNTFAANPAVGKTKKLKKGDYKVYVELTNNDHSSLSERTISKTIPVMVDA
jgi:hypothetical protein